MPQIQVLPGAPGFGSQLGQALGGGLNQGISAGLSQMLEQKQNQKKMANLLSSLGIQAPSGREISTNASVSQKSAPSKSPLQKLTQEQVLAASIMNPALAPALSSIYKTQQKEMEEVQSKEIGQESLSRMSELLEEGNIGFGSKLKAKAFGGKTAEDVGEFESLSGALEALLVDKVSRGTLSNARFKYITETLLPKPNDRAATIKGKLKALSKELDLELPQIEEKKSDKISKTFSSLPSAKEYSGKKIRHTSSGRIFQSDGKKWSEVR